MSGWGWALVIASTLVTIIVGVTVVFLGATKHERTAQRRAANDRKRHPIRIVR